MFIFAPGSGFSGPAVKVEPGFELSEVQNVTQSLVHELSLTTDVDKSSTQIFNMSPVSSAIHQLIWILLSQL